jgi:hypothetical protein
VVDYTQGQIEAILKVMGNIMHFTHTAKSAGEATALVYFPIEDEELYKSTLRNLQYEAVKVSDECFLVTGCTDKFPRGYKGRPL